MNVAVEKTINSHENDICTKIKGITLDVTVKMDILEMK